MNKLERLLQKCNKLIEPGGGTAQEYNDALRELGRHLQTLHAKGKVYIENDSMHILSANDILNIRAFVKEAGMYPPYEEGGVVDEHRFTEAIAYCHMDLSKVIEESNTKYHVSYYYYRGDNNPKGVPAALADLLLRIFRICCYFDIDIESVLLEKHELYKKSSMEHKKKTDKP